MMDLPANTDGATTPSLLEEADIVDRYIFRCAETMRKLMEKGVLVIKDQEPGGPQAPRLLWPARRKACVGCRQCARQQEFTACPQLGFCERDHRNRHACPCRHTALACGGSNPGGAPPLGHRPPLLVPEVAHSAPTGQR